MNTEKLIKKKTKELEKCFIVEGKITGFTDERLERAKKVLVSAILEAKKGC